MRGKTKTRRGGARAMTVTALPKVAVRPHRQVPRTSRLRRQQANREKRLELARMRQAATLTKVTQLRHRNNPANRQRLTGKGLFYCASPSERATEIQRRRGEANC